MKPGEKKSTRFNNKRQVVYDWKKGKTFKLYGDIGTISTQCTHPSSRLEIMLVAIFLVLVYVNYYSFKF